MKLSSWRSHTNQLLDLSVKCTYLTRSRLRAETQRDLEALGP